MPFPFSSSGTLEIHAPGEASLTAIVAAVEDALRGAHAKKLCVKDGEISFRGGLFGFGGRWNQLLAISFGQIRFARQGDLVLIHYRISFLQMLVVVTAVVGLMLGYVDRAPYKIVVFGWLWLFGGNYFIALYRFPRFIRAAAEKGAGGAAPFLAE